MKENLYTHKSIRTHSGQYVNVFEPDIDTITIEDIAHALSRQPRFGGHLPVEYSVARHSIACAGNMRNNEMKLIALLHDATEAYLIDLPKPIKNEMKEYRDVEDRLAVVIAKKFGIRYPFPQIVHDIDSAMLVVEWENVFLKKHSLWARFRYWFDHHFQKRKFLRMYYDLQLTKNKTLIWNS